MKERYYWERAQSEQCRSFAKKPDGLMVGLDDLRSLSNLCDADSKPWHSGFVCARCASPGCVQGHLAESGTSVLWKPFINISKNLFFFFFPCYFQFTEEIEMATKLSSSRNAALQPVPVSPVYEAV